MSERAKAIAVRVATDLAAALGDRLLANPPPPERAEERMLFVMAETEGDVAAAGPALAEAMPDGPVFVFAPAIPCGVEECAVARVGRCGVRVASWYAATVGGEFRLQAAVVVWSEQ